MPTPLMNLTRNGNATVWGPDRKLHIAGPDVLREEYDPVTGLFSHYLTETASTNLINISDETGFGAFSAGPTTDESISSAGSPVENIHPTIRHVVGGQLAANYAGVTAGVRYILSTLCKPVGGPIGVRVSSNFIPTAVSVLVDPAGVITYPSGQGALVDSFAAEAGGGWFWLSTVFDATQTVSGVFYWRSDVTEGYFAVSQVEASGGLRTSYIPTIGSTVTRAADNWQTKNTDWFSNTEGTLLIDMDWFYEDGSNQNIITASSGNFLYSIGNGNYVDELLTYDGTTAETWANAPSTVKVAIAWGSGTYTVHGNGAKRGEVAYGGTWMNPGAAIKLGSGSTKLHVRSFRYYPNELTDAQAIAETTP